jgi:polyisoprenoid-binding protein YceI
MKQLSFVLTLIILCYTATAQDTQLTRNGKISFFSTTPVEDIKATNNEVSSVLNTKTGALQFIVLIKGFQFKKAAMKEHFNQKQYMDSDNFPKSEFKGTITDLSKISFTKDGVYPVTVDGTLTLHGVTNKVKTSGTITVKDGKISSNAVFKIKLSDYKITVPSFVTTKVAETVEITVACNYEPYGPKL